MSDNKNKLRILYDASFLSYAYEKNAKRSGIYFVAFNIFMELIKKPQLDITLYYNYRRYWYLKDVLASDKNFNKYCVHAISNSNQVMLYLAYLNYKCRKRNDLKDSFFKKVIRFLTYRSFKVYDKFAVFDNDFAKKIDFFDVCFSPFNVIPDEVLNNKTIKRFVFLHDTIPIIMKDLYGNNSFDDFKWFYDIANSINKEDYYFANSNSTKNDFIKYVENIDPEKIFVTYLGANENFYQEKDSEKITAVKKKYNIPLDKKYIFSLCSLEPRKNLVFAIKNFIEFIKKNKLSADAIAGQVRNEVAGTVSAVETAQAALNGVKGMIDDFVLVLGGGHWDKFLPQLEKEISDLNEYKDKILKIGYVDDEDLAALYSGAEMFVYPSIYEGFGMPVLEAMQCGCPVITSNVSSLPEVIGDCGIQIDPHSDEEMISAYEKMYFDKEFAAECSRKGLERAKVFTWKNCVDKIVKQIEQVL